MPVYQITDNRTGKKYRVEGNSVPSAKDLFGLVKPYYQKVAQSASESWDKMPINPSNVMEGYKTLADSDNPVKTYLQSAGEQFKKAGSDYADWIAQPTSLMADMKVMGGAPSIPFGETIPRSARINGITRAQFGELLANGNPSALSHIPEAIQKHGILGAQDAIRNEIMDQVAMASKDMRPRVRANISALEPLINQLLKGGQ